MNIALSCRGISKHFGRVEVLHDISFDLGKGKIIGLIGENGAGKSTLMNIIGGGLSPRSGSITLSQSPYAPESPQDSIKAGIAFIHQELNLFSNLSIAENFFISFFPVKSKLIDRRKMYEPASRFLKIVGLNHKPDVPVEELTPAEKQMVEIAKALAGDPRIIIFDEPTTSLTEHEIQHLFWLITTLKKKDISMFFISHNLDHVKQIADDIIILRDGKQIRWDTNESVSIANMVFDRVGRDLDQFFPDRNIVPLPEIILRVSGMTYPGILRNILFHLKKQEVLGFYGLIGSGRTEMVRMIYGLDRPQEGSIEWKGKIMHDPNPICWIRENVAFLTEDRREEGLLLGASVRENVQLVGMPEFSRSLLRWIDRKSLTLQSRKKTADVSVKYQDFNNQPVSTLSGGNQQKVVLAKWLVQNPELLIMDEPTRGIDIGAKHDIYELINTLVSRGTSVILISSDLEELLGMCDRVLVMNQGAITSQFEKSEFNQTDILKAALHTHTS